MIGQTALYRHFDAEGRLLYVGISQKPDERRKQHNYASAWGPMIARQDVEWFPSFREAMRAERRAILTEGPLHNNTPLHIKVRRPLPEGAPAGSRLLAEWLDAKGLTQGDLAHFLQITQASVSVWIGGKRPGAENIAKIEELTEGAVPASSWHDPTPR